MLLITFSGVKICCRSMKMLIKVFLKMFASGGRGLAAQCERSLTPPLLPPQLSPYAAHRYKKHPPHNVLPSLQENQVHKGQSTPRTPLSSDSSSPTRSSAHTRAPSTAMVRLPLACPHVADSQADKRGPRRLHASSHR